jgi:hypothetical protein
MGDSKKSKSTSVIANPSRALADTFFLVKDKKLRLLKSRKKKVPRDTVTKKKGLFLLKQAHHTT